MENGNISNPKKKISSINTESIVINESDYSEINDKTPIDTLGNSMSKDNKPKKKIEFDIPKKESKLKSGLNTDMEIENGHDSGINSIIGNTTTDKKERKIEKDILKQIKK